MEKSNYEKENERNKMALFKYAIIAPLINDMNPFKSKEEFYRDASSKVYTLPNGKETIIDSTTIKSWYLRYKRLGFECLLKKSRADERSI